MFEGLKKGEDSDHCFNSYLKVLGFQLIFHKLSLGQCLGH